MRPHVPVVLPHRKSGSAGDSSLARNFRLSIEHGLISNQSSAVLSACYGRGTDAVPPLYIESAISRRKWRKSVGDCSHSSQLATRWPQAISDSWGVYLAPCDLDSSTPARPPTLEGFLWAVAPFQTHTETPA